MPEHKRIPALAPILHFFGHGKRYRILHKHFKRKIWELCCYRDMCLNVCLWRMASETWLQRKKMREEITKEIQGLGTAVPSFIVFNMQIILKPERDHLPLKPHYWEWKCEQAQSRIPCCLENRRLFCSVSSMAVISFQEFSQKCSCTWHKNKRSGTKQWVKMAGKHHI